MTATPFRILTGAPGVNLNGRCLLQIRPHRTYHGIYPQILAQRNPTHDSHGTRRNGNLTSRDPPQPDTLSAICISARARDSSGRPHPRGCKPIFHQGTSTAGGSARQSQRRTHEPFQAASAGAPGDRHYNQNGHSVVRRAPRTTDGARMTRSDKQVLSSPESCGESLGLNSK